MGARASGAAAVVCLVFAARDAGADTLAFEAPAACGSAESFVASVRGRTPLARFEPGSGGRAFRVVVRASAVGEPVVGSLVVTGASGATSTRDVDGDSCVEVTDALSLVVALTIDPNARTIASEPAPPPLPSLLPLLPEKKPVERRPAATGEEPTTWAPRLALEGVVGVGAAPSTALGLGIDVGLAREPARATTGVATALGLHARASVEKTVFAAEAPSADMVRAIAVVSLCPLAARVGPLRSEACAGVGAGLVRFAGEGAPNPSAKARVWSHVEAALVTTVPLGRRFFLAARASFEVPLTRDELVFVRPDVFVHRASAVTGSFGAGIGLRL